MLLCPICLSPQLSFPEGFGHVDPTTGYCDDAEAFYCRNCKASGYSEDCIDQPDTDEPFILRPDPIDADAPPTEIKSTLNSLPFEAA